MSGGFAQSWQLAREQLTRLNDAIRFGDHCVRWIVAGSYRRRRPEVHDIDIVAVPGTTGGLFGDQESALWKALDAAIDSGIIRHAAPKHWGGVNRRFIFENHVYECSTCDETAWPVLVAVKTGPERFTKGLVTQRCKGGMLPDDLTVGKDGQGRSWRVWRGRVIETGEDEVERVIDPGVQLAFDDERQFIECVCGKWIEPWERT